MVATRRSLGCQPQIDTSPPAPPPSSLSRAQQAALKKLDIAGTDALKGDPKAAQAARDQVQTYHYRGAVYAADANTPSSWLENQPKRYLKRSRDVSSGAENGADDSIVVTEEEHEETARPTKRRSLPVTQSSNHSHNHKPEISSSARGKPRAGRGARHSFPSKRKFAALDNNNNDNDNDNDNEDDDDNTNMENDYANSGGQDDRVCLPHLPNWLPESASDRKRRLSHRANPIPTEKSPVPDNEAMNAEIQHLKQEAKQKNYQVQPLNDKDLAAAQVIRLVKKQTLLRLSMQEWQQAKKLLEAKKSEAAQDTTKQPEDTNFQPVIDLAGSPSDDGNQQVDDRMVVEQWEREQEQNRRRDQLNIPETSPQTPAPALLTASNDLPRPSSSTNAHPAATPSTGSTNRTANSHDSFASLPPDADLPTVGKDGSRLRWSVQRSMSVDQDGEQRAEYAIDLARLEGESRSAKRRRIERERLLVANWVSLTGARLVERNGGR